MPIFEWNENKAKLNLRRHGISFAEAESIFKDQLLLTFLDEAHSQDEERFISIGLSNISRVLLVVHTEISESAETIKIRIISCRKATLWKEKFMKKIIKDEMRDEYDFSEKKGVRGKYYEAMKNGYTTIIHKSDGSTETIETRPIFLASDLQEKFPNSEAVNQALRRLIGLEKSKV